MERVIEINKVPTRCRIITDAHSYEEELINPQNKDKILIFTYPTLGNIGISKENVDITPTCLGVIVNELSPHDSHFKKNLSLTAYLDNHQIPYFTNMDVRSLIQASSDSELNTINIER